MNNILFFIKKYKIQLSLLLIFALFIWAIVALSRTKVVNPASNTLDQNPRAGKDYALVYNSGALFDAIKQSDENLKLIKVDLLRYARATYPNLKNPDTLVGFTFDKKYKKKDNAYTFTGHYYSIKNLVQASITVFDKGIIRLSLTDLKTKTNRDDLLSLNGPKNKLLTQLPINKDYYSIRYLNTNDKIIVTFYQGYTQKDIDAALAVLKNAYGNAFKESDFTYSINGIGIFYLDEVVSNIGNPDPLNHPDSQDDE